MDDVVFKEAGGAGVGVEGRLGWGLVNLQLQVSTQGKLMPREKCNLELLENLLISRVLSLTWWNFPGMDKSSHAQQRMVENNLSIPKLQRLHHWSLGNDPFHTFNWCNYVCIPVLRCIYVSKRGSNLQYNTELYETPWPLPIYRYLPMYDAVHDKPRMTSHRHDCIYGFRYILTLVRIISML